MNRAAAIADLVEKICTINLDHPVRVGIDGVSASGKTMLADELVQPLSENKREVIRASIDGFHNPRHIRYQRGRISPQGYYEDSFNYQAIVSSMLIPLGPQGNLAYRTRQFDFIKNQVVDVPFLTAAPDAVLLFEGIFLLRPELRDYWDFSIFVHTDFDVTLKRAQKRDLYLFQTPEKVREIYEKRYIPGEQIYLDNESPSSKANVIWINNEISCPELIINHTPTLSSSQDNLPT